MEQDIKCCFHCKKDHEYLTDCYYCSVPQPVCIMIKKMVVLYVHLVLPF